MRFWIKKEEDREPNDKWVDAYVFTINRDSGSVLFSSMPAIWYHIGLLEIAPIFEDLYIIALSVFGIDKRVSRRLTADNWTRDIEVSIPVLQFEKWIDTKNVWENMLSFLTGDRWHISFRKTEARCSHHKKRSTIQVDLSSCDCVSLFSGGLDSFCGAITLLESGLSPCLIGHNEYPKLRLIQEGFVSDFQRSFPSQNPRFIGFTAGSRAPHSNISGKILQGSENTSRGRSLLFILFALTIAGTLGKNVPVYIPENGFIGLNVALTQSRRGSCSTRTTHPYFLRELRGILSIVGITNPIENIFAYATKREIVRSVKDHPLFLSGFRKTISCSHPCQSRYNKAASRVYPVNCGYCYPCIVRKASLLDVVDNGDYSYSETPSAFLSRFIMSDRSSDLNAILNTIYRFKHCSSYQIRQMIRSTGPLSEKEFAMFERLYASGINDILELFSKDLEMEKYMS